jgi:hypothetical protein
VNDKASHIKERFPDKKHSIDRLMAKDPEFFALCEDYDTCVNALQYWANSKDPEAEIRVNEYRVIARELEEEVVEALIALKPLQLD